MYDKTSPVDERLDRSEKSRVSSIIKLFRYVFSSAKLICTIYLTLSIVFSLTRPLVPYVWKAYLDRANVFEQDHQVFELVFFVVAYYLLRIFENLVWRYTHAYEHIERLDIVQQNRFQEKINSRLFKKLSKVKAEYFEVPKINDLISRVFEFTGDEWQGLNRQVMVQGYLIIARTIAVLSVAVTLYFFNPWLTLIIVFSAIPVVYTTFVGEKINFKAKNDNANLKRETQYYQDLLLHDAVKEIKTLSLFDFFFNKWKEKSDELYVKEKKIQVKQFFINILNDTITSLVNVSANIFVIILFIRGQISIGTLGGVLTMIVALTHDIHTLFKAFGAFVSKKNEAAQFFDLLQLPEDRDEGHGLETIHSIRAENLSYRYPLTQTYVLKDINMQVCKGEKIALVGANGAGKTTFVKLLTGMLNASEGRLLINDQDMETINPFSYYDQISSVFQEPPRYTSLTIGDNVQLADRKRESSHEAQDLALEKAGLIKMDKDTLVGKDVGGTELSGGQWQKVAIARAHYRNRDMILLDEPTSNLDPLAETEIFKKYLEMAEDKTVILVTHRISVAALADRIIVFSGGQIVEDGTHDELTQKSGHYHKLFTEQAKWYDR